MLAKLLKHDNRAIFKYWWIAAVSSLFVAAFDGLCIRISSVSYTTHESLVNLATLGIVFANLALMMFPILTEVLIVIRFYKHFFTDEGYLTFTLPVKKTSLLNSKLLSALLFIFASSMILVFDYFIVFAICDPEFVFSADFWNDLGDIFSEIYGYLGVHGAVYTILGIAIFFVAMLMQVLFIFLCITLAAVVAKKHKVLAAIGIYYGANVVSSFIMQLFSIFGLFVIFENLSYLDELASFIGFDFLFFGLLGIFIVIAAALYLAEYYLLDKRLNLE